MSKQLLTLLSILVAASVFVTACSDPKPTLTSTPGVGSTQISPKDGMTILFVPAGEFSMGSDVGTEFGSENERPVHTVYLDSFWIDRTEVTNVMYAKCERSGKCKPPHSTGSSTRSSYYGNSEYDNYPVIDIAWNEAKNYCEWAGRRLPTEAEWEKAASWDDAKKEKRVYPWGNEDPKINFLNYMGNVGDTTEVGRYYPRGESFYGALDMAGNVLEWVADWYSENYYASSPSSNPLGPDSGQYRVFRGGSWSNVFGVNNVRSSDRSGYPPDDRDEGLIGIRCARSP